MIQRRPFFLFVVMLALAGCQRSGAEKLAYQHAEEQYRINAEASVRYHRAKAAQEQREEEEEEERNRENSAEDEKE